MAEEGFVGGLEGTWGRDQERENMIEEIMAKIFPNLMKSIEIQFNEIQHTCIFCYHNKIPKSGSFIKKFM